jgi:hypothetical protein
VGQLVEEKASVDEERDVLVQKMNVLINEKEDVV